MPAAGSFISSAICSGEGSGIGKQPIAISISDTPRLHISDSTE